jgi:hypothetical protein
MALKNINNLALSISMRDEAMRWGLLRLSRTMARWVDEGMVLLQCTTLASLLSGREIYARSSFAHELP